MIIAPIQNTEGTWDILCRELGTDWGPLPRKIRVRAATKEEANLRVYTVDEQLGSLGFQTDPQEAA